MKSKKIKEDESYGVHWFRRDLRVAGNRAFQKQFQEHDGRVLGLFCFDKKFLSRSDFSVNRFQFFLDTLKSLQSELRALGSDLLVLDIGPEEAFKDLFSKIKGSGKKLPAQISWSRDYEPFARKRDGKIEKLLEKEKVEFFSERDHLLIEPEELQKDTGGSYQVYSPFAKKWLQVFQREETQKRIQKKYLGFTYLNKLVKNEVEPITEISWGSLVSKKNKYPDFLDIYTKDNAKKVSVSIPKAGSQEAFKQLKAFSKKITNYGEDRDFPDLEATSKLSLFLKNGSLTIPQVISYLNLKSYREKKKGEDIFFSELIWREFYYHILYWYPEVETQSFIGKYRKINWENNKKLFQAWKKGKTGFPIVDAGMRQLKETGWMHNRVRMIVASFLTKDLLVDWRWGERYFMETLLDGDLAPNNGGWQWAASTGCDPQPYFRIFNPWLQSKKFDPEGLYIKKYIPELSEIDAKRLHEPILGHKVYPEPIVDHKVQKVKALALYKEL